jgi:hypothetical protein
LSRFFRYITLSALLGSSSSILGFAESPPAMDIPPRMDNPPKPQSTMPTGPLLMPPPPSPMSPPPRPGPINSHASPSHPTHPYRPALAKRKGGTKRIPREIAVEKVNTKSQKDNALKGRKKPEAFVAPKVVPLKELSRKTTVIDARRLTEHKLTETIRYIKTTKDKENKDLRLKLQNATINPEHFAKILDSFEAAGVLEQVREIGFVMLPGEKKNQEIQEHDFIQKIVPKLKNLEGIELSCLGVTDKLLEAIAKGAPHLKGVSLFGLGITDATLLKLDHLLPKLTKIHLVNTSIGPKGIQLLVAKFPELRSLGISGQHLKDSDFIALKEGFGNLYSFSAVGQTFKDMKTIKSLLEVTPKLQALDLSETNVTDDVARDISETAQGLRTLDISETKITGAGVKDIVQKLDLHKLKIDRLRGIGDEELTFIIDKQKGLKTFHFAGASFSNVVLMKMILDLPHLVDVTFIPGDSSWMLTEGVAHALILKRDPKLQYLHIQANRLPETLRALFEREQPTLRIEYAPSGPVPL